MQIQQSYRFILSIRYLKTENKKRKDEEKSI